MTSDTTNPVITLTASDATAHTDATVTMVSTPYATGASRPFWEATQAGLRRRPAPTERSRKRAARKQATASKRRNRR